ncbi:MAG: nicotinate-nucleotide--dimethylbenzimidazole phosphoribosyltransferase, partial [Acidobacteria bacterium]|nr:nicotinate-nucleotide--dimethylbenzimidazole phosphoribosyltransferase [Acidobacteriota bacterium]
MNDEWLAQAREEMDRKVKPPKSLGRLESAAIQLAALQRTLAPRFERVRILIFAADHGVTAEGVSAYPREVTAQMMRTFAAGGAAITVLARTLGLEVEVIDVGVDADLPPLPKVVAAKVRRGSRNFRREAALTAAEVEAALAAGRAAVERAAAAGNQGVALGDMGIGNTTAAAALLSALTGAAPQETVGRGTGLDDRGLQVKRDVVEASLRLHAQRFGDAQSALAAVGGL